MRPTQDNWNGIPVYFGGHSKINSPLDRRISRRGEWLLVGTVALMCSGLLTLAVRDDAQSRGEKPVAVETAASAPKESKPLERPAVEFYTGGIRGNLFSPPLPPAPKPAAPKPVPKPKPLPSLPPPVKVVAPIVINPFADWKYTGTVRMNDQIMALLENNGTKEGRYVRVNEAFDGGATISSITDGGVTLLAAGKPYFIAKQQEGSLVPLNAPTAPAPPPGGAPGTPIPGGGPPPPTNTGLPPGAIVTLPNGMSLTAGQAIRRGQRLNRRFNR